MSRNLIVIAPVALAIALAGCSSVTTAVNDINAFTGALSSPSANQAAANLKAGAEALVCQVADVSALAGEIEKQGLGSKVLVKDTTDLYTASSAVCAALGGSALPGTVTVPASATTAAQ